jgi:hypothetical protein
MHPIENTRSLVIDGYEKGHMRLDDGKNVF